MASKLFKSGIKVVSFVVLLLALFVLIYFAMCVIFPQTETYTSVYSLGDGSKLSGNFMLASGSIKETSVYFYFAPTRNGGYIKDYVIASDTVIFMDQDNHPYLKSVCHVGICYHEFHVPKGTIIKQYSLGVNV